ncbi:MAG: hypothetical protein ISR58_09655 [Anaerolineales bacterium]|nr:hypothetical protein [Chloroflexota bacterium]MBL6981442.1 hypothetical protein [Anaerolineales bacterium]
MNESFSTLTKFLVLLCLVIVLGSAAACSMPRDTSPDIPNDDGQLVDDEHDQAVEEPPGDDGVWIEFDVDRNELHPGECTLLWWHVEGGFGVFLNGEQVELGGEREICLEESTIFILEVDLGDSADVREIEIMVVEFSEEEPPPDDEPIDEEVQIEFFAERTDLQVGECTMLFWNVEGGGFGAFFNGEPVERAGEREVCPDETMGFVLGVDMGEEMEAREIEIVVGGMPGDESPSESPSGDEGTSSETTGGTSSGTTGGTTSGGCSGQPVISSFTANPSTIKAGESSKLEWGPVTNGNTAELVGSVEISSGVGGVGSPGSAWVNPTVTTTYTLTGTGCGGTSTKNVTVTVSGGGTSGSGSFSADIEPTDIYPGSQPHGQFHVRITNHGPGTINNLKITVDCSTQTTDKNTLKSGPGKTSQFTITQSMKPGETHSHPTNLNLDFNIYSYIVECTVKPDFTDPKPGNNTYGEGFNGSKYIGP